MSNNKGIKMSVTSDVVMYVEPKKITICCPYTYTNNECLAYRNAKEAPLVLNAVRFQDRMIVAPQNTFSPRVKALLVAGFRRSCLDCVLKMKTRERSGCENAAGEFLKSRQR